MKVKFSRVAALLAVCVLLAAMTPAAAAPANPTQVGWTSYPQATTDAINAVTTASATDAWAVGDSSQVYHWNGTAWSPVPNGLGALSTSINAVAPVPGQADHAFAVGQPEGGTAPSLVLDCTPAGCTRDTTVPAAHQLDSVWVVSTTDIWAVGDQGTILHKVGTTWQQLTGQPITQYHMIQMLPDGTGWAVGGTFPSTINPIPGPGVLIHYDGTQWQDVTAGLSPAPTVPLVGVSFASPAEGYIVGGNPNGGTLPLAYHYTGTWANDAPTSLGSPTLFWDVWDGPGGPWATGNGGQIFRRTGANTWTAAYSQAGTKLFGVWLTQDGLSGWAGGATDSNPSSGVFVRYTGGPVCPGCTPRAYLPFVVK